MDQCDLPPIEAEIVSPEVEEPAPGQDFSSLFSTEDELVLFFSELSKYMLTLWMDNDRLLALVVPGTVVESVKQYIADLDHTPMGEMEAAVLKSEYEGLEVVASDEVDRYELVTLRERIKLQQAMFLRHWASKSGIQDYLVKSGVPYLPTTQELGIAFLMMTAIPESQGSRVLSATSMPPTVARR